MRGIVRAVDSPKPSKRDRTRNALLVALQELLLEGDPESVSVPQIVKRAGMAQGTFYNYFDSLPDAVVGVGQLLLQEHVRVLEEVVAGSKDVPEVMARSCKQALMVAGNRPDIAKLLFDSGVPVDLLLVSMRAHMREDVDRAVETGQVKLSNPELASALYTGALIAAGNDIYRGRLSLEAVPDVTRMTLGLLGVDSRKADRLASAPQEFVDWGPLPLSAL